MTLNNIRISTQVYMGYALVLVALLVMAGIAWTSFSQVGDAFAENARLTGQVQDISNIRQQFGSVSLNASEFNSSVDPAVRKRTEAEYAALLDDLNAFISTLRSAENIADAKAMLQNVDGYGTSMSASFALRERLKELDETVLRLGPVLEDNILALDDILQASGDPQMQAAGRRLVLEAMHARRAVAHGIGIWTNDLTNSAMEQLVELAQVVSNVEKMPLTTTAQNLLAQAKIPITGYTSAFTDIRASTLEIHKNQAQQAEFLEATRTQADNNLNSLMGQQHTLQNGVEQTITSSRVLMIVISGIALLVGSLAAIVIGRNISVPLANVAATIQNIAQTKNLSQTINYTARNEIGQITSSFDSLMHELRSALGGVSQNTRQVAAAAGQASSAVGQVSDGSQNQLNAISQISTAMEQTSKAITDVAQNSGAATDHARKAADLVEHGKEKIQMMVDVANVITDNSKKINQITDVISRIANQTNMLSLNAAIEAARAGEHGKGFAVVAEEVRKLAEHSAASVEQISGLVGHADREAQKSLQMVKDVNGDMESIADSVRRSDSMVQSIAAAITEQSSSVEEINANIRNLSKIGESNATAAEEITATMVELARLADQTRTQTEQFRI